MTPSALKKRLSEAVMFFLFAAAQPLYAQPDTLVVYDYVHFTDTLWLEPDVSELKSIETANLTVDTGRINQPSVIISEEKSATILVPLIINQKINQNETMRKTGWITLLFLSIQTTNFAQQKWSVLAGTEVMWLQHNTSTISKSMWKGLYLGTERRFNFKESAFSLSTGLIASYMTPPNEYLQVKEIDPSLPYLEYDYAKIYTGIMLNELNSGLFTLNQLQFSLPLKLYYQFGNWQSYLGLEFNKLFFLNTQQVTGTQSYRIPLKTSFNLVSYTGGIQYRLSEHFSAIIGISNSFNNLYNSLSIPTGVSLGVERYDFKTLRIEIGGTYIF